VGVLAFRFLGGGCGCLGAGWLGGFGVVVVGGGGFGGGVFFVGGGDFQFSRGKPNVSLSHQTGVTLWGADDFSPFSHI